MPTIKFWKVELFREQDRMRALPGIIGTIHPFFTGYSREKPDINLLMDRGREYIEFHTAPDMLVSRMLRRDAFDYVHLTPVHDTDGGLIWAVTANYMGESVTSRVSASFEDVARPLMEWLAERTCPLDPSLTAIVSNSDAELMTTYKRVVIQEDTKN